MSAHVPQIIHQIWSQGEELIPDKYNKWRLTWWQAMPHWRVETWSAARIRHLVASKFPQYLEWFDSLKTPVEQADVGRLFILAEHGGAYTDMDTGARTPFDQYDGLVQLCQEGRHFVLLGKWPNVGAWDINNAFIISTAGNPAWRDRLLPFFYVRRNITGALGVVSESARVFARAGPEAWTLASRQFPQDIVIAPVGVFYTDRGHSKATYLEHLSDGAWTSWYELLLAKRTFLVLLVLLSLLGVFIVLDLRRKRIELEQLKQVLEDEHVKKLIINVPEEKL